MDSTLKIAHCVESYAPAPGGMAEVVKQLSERMANVGHSVTVFTSYKTERTFDTLNKVAIKSYKIQGNAVTGIHGETVKYIDDLITGEFDIIVLFAAQQWAADLILPILPQIKSAKIFVPTGFSMLYNEAWTSYYNEMKNWMKNFDMNVFLGETYRDAHFAEIHGIQNRALIPNGASEEEFGKHNQINIRSRWSIPSDHKLLLHVGSFVTSKGQLDAMRILFHSGISKVTLLMIGNGAENFWRQIIRNPLLYLRWHWSRFWGNQKVLFVTATREETIAAYQEADLFLFPSKIECSPIVLFEAMASHTPFLVTDVGNSKEIIEWSKGGWVMTGTISEDGFTHVNIAAAASLLKNTLLNESQLDSATKSGYNAWKSKFTWQIIADRYIELYQSLIKARLLRG